MPHIHVDIAPDTPPEKFLALAKYCLQRSGVTMPFPIVLAKANGTIKRRVRRDQQIQDVTFPDAQLEALWQQVASWGTHWWITAAPVLDMLLEQYCEDDEACNWSHIEHVLSVAGQAFASHVTGLEPHMPHDDLVLFRQADLLPERHHNVIGQAIQTGADLYHNDAIQKAWGFRAALTRAEQAAMRYAQRAAGAMLQPILGNMRARVAQRLLQRERQAARRLVPQAIAQRAGARQLATWLADDVGHWQRDWERVARTELQDAAHHGTMEAMIAHHPTNQTMQADGSMTPVAQPVPPPVQVFRFPAVTACDHCLRLYTNADGTPRLYPLATVLGNPTNFGVPAAQWTAQTGTTHPNCLCSAWQEYTPAHATLFASMRRP